MKLRKIILENFRSYRDKTIIDIDDFTVFIGKNDAGKSTIFEALDIFFENSKIDQGDGCIFGDPSNVRIGCVFSDLPEEIIIDSTNSTSLEKEYLLNQNGFLEIYKIFDCSKVTPKADVVVLANHPENSRCIGLLSLNNGKLKALAREIGVNLGDVDQTKNAELRSAIRALEDLILREMEISLMKDTGKAIWESLSAYLPIYALFKSDRASTDQDSEAQDPMKLAIKEAIKSHEKQLEEMTVEVNKKVQQIVDLTVEKIKDFSVELAEALNPTVKNKNWDSLFSVSLTDEDKIPINKRGSGARRLILLSFFRAKAELDSVSSNSTGIIYAIEEPETSQHPHNQKILIDTLKELSEHRGNQVLVTTHTPVLVKNIKQANIRYIKQEASYPIVSVCDDNNAQEIALRLGIIPDHKVKCFFGVEGKHDISFLCEISKIINSYNPLVPNLYEAQLDGTLVFIPLGGSSLELWISRINNLNRPQFYLMDRDNQPPAEPKYIDAFNRFRDEGHTAWITKKLELENYIHPDIVRAKYANYSGTGAGFEDVPYLLAKAIHEESPQSIPWEEFAADKEKVKKKESHAKKIINNEIVKDMTEEKIRLIDIENEIEGILLEIGARLRA